MRTFGLTRQLELYNYTLVQTVENLTTLTAIHLTKDKNIGKANFKIQLTETKTMTKEIDIN